MNDSYHKNSETQMCICTLLYFAVQFQNDVKILW